MKFPIRQRLSNSPIGKLYRLRHRLKTTRGIFKSAYQNNVWRSKESSSGTGSTLAQTAAVRDALPSLLAELQARTLLDAPCGDCHWMKTIDIGLVHYIGVDIVPEIVDHNQDRLGSERRAFILADITQDRLPRADVLLCRDALVHLTFAQVRSALGNFKASGARFLLTTTFPEKEQNVDLEFTGLWRPLNLTRPPFNFPSPLRLITEGCPDEKFEDKALGLWELSALSH